MKTLSLLQPWASLVAEGLKRVETRAWRTSYTGPLAIHASKRRVPLRDWPDGTIPSAAARAAWRHLAGIRPAVYGWNLGDIASQERGDLEAPILREVRDALPYGAVLAVVELCDCVPIERNSDGQVALGGDVMSTYPTLNPLSELAFGDFTPGRWAWLLGPPRKLDEPVPARGSLGLWEWSP